ncbi:THO complex subunit 5 homolog B-like [Chironomus tepperi]|uniref:THO complex subunit 5 homolog B-like n=1 Tax=Chironomus tepperi TaxID=113505 RepID=UPI00391F5B17
MRTKVTFDKKGSNEISIEESCQSPIKQFKECFDKLNKIIRDVKALKVLKTDEAKMKITEKKIQGSMLIVKLKKLNRLDRQRLLELREILQGDSNLLKLENLLYEANQLKKEINKCFSFKSEDEDIELVLVEEFLKSAQLQFELQQRKEYSKQCKDLEKEKEDVAEKTIEYRNEWEIHKLIRLLPQPLYLAYTKLCAYSEIIDKRLSVSIEGDQEEAKIIEMERKQMNEREDSDNENGFGESMNHRKSLNQKRLDLFKHHPLSVKFNISMKDLEETYTVILNYLPALGFITVQGKLNIDSKCSVATARIITQERILSSLYADDFGEGSPNPKTIFQLQNVQLHAYDLNKSLNEMKLGKPFKWAQNLCGINFTEHLNINQPQKLCDETVPDLIQQIRRKLRARISHFNH